MRGFRLSVFNFQFRPALLLLAVLSIPAGAAIVDRIAAIVDKEVITQSEVNQLITLKILPQRQGENDDEYHRRVLDAMIAQSLRFRYVERFGAEDISKDQIESRLLEIRRRFSSDAAFEQALRSTELTLDELRSIVKRRLQVEAYIEERFSPQIFVSLEEIERYYRETWRAQRRERGLPDQSLDQATEEIRTLLKAERLQTEVGQWTTQLRERANVDVYIYR